MMQLARECRKSGGADKQACGSFGFCFGDNTLPRCCRSARKKNEED